MNNNGQNNQNPAQNPGQHVTPGHLNPFQGTPTGLGVQPPNGLVGAQANPSQLNNMIPTTSQSSHMDVSS